MRTELKNFLEDVIEHENLRDMEKDGKVYEEISRGMYRLQQAGIVAQELSENAYSSMATNKVSTHQNCGPTDGNHFALH